MSLEMSAFMEEVESLHTQGMEVTGPHVSPLPTTPIGEVTPNQVTRNIKYLAPTLKSTRKLKMRRYEDNVRTTHLKEAKTWFTIFLNENGSNSIQDYHISFINFTLNRLCLLDNYSECLKESLQNLFDELLYFCILYFTYIANNSNLLFQIVFHSNIIFQNDRKHLDD